MSSMLNYSRIMVQKLEDWMMAYKLPELPKLRRAWHRTKYLNKEYSAIEYINYMSLTIGNESRILEDESPDGQKFGPKKFGIKWWWVYTQMSSLPTETWGECCSFTRGPCTRRLLPELCWYFAPRQSWMPNLPLCNCWCNESLPIRKSLHYFTYIHFN